MLTPTLGVPQESSLWPVLFVADMNSSLGVDDLIDTIQHCLFI